jgi:hypothetical protein
MHFIRNSTQNKCKKKKTKKKEKKNNREHFSIMVENNNFCQCSKNNLFEMSPNITLKKISGFI